MKFVLIEEKINYINEKIINFKEIYYIRLLI
jgi:hypothetical protein